MRTMGDWELLQAYAKQRSETAFAELVQRHLNWVYSSALRQVGNTHLAEDVTQAVFVLLARKAGNLRRGTVLTGWLFHTTCFVAARAVRSEQRRKTREQAASAMSTITDNDKLWEQLAPHLDQAVAALSESDRSAILLRFYERKSLREVGEQLGVSEEAAKKRVARALDKMREHLTRRGVVFGAIGLAGILTEQTVQAAPAALGVSVVKSATAGASVLPELVRETLEAWHLAKLKLAAGIAAVGVSICGVIFTANTLPKREPPPSYSTNVAAAVPQAAESTAKPQPAIATALPAQPVTDRVMQIRVVDQRTKQGLAEVQVLANIDEQKKTGRTDKDGLYELDLPVNNPSRFIIRVQQDRFVPMWAVWDVRDGVFRLPEQFTFTLDPSTSVGGVVLDEQGRPIAGATVSISLRGSQYGDGSIHINPWALKSAATDMLGRWRFDQAPADLSELEFRLTHPDYISTFYPGYPNNAKLSDAKLRDMTAEMEMKKGLSVAGAVFDVQGRPVAGAFVGLGESRSHVDFVNTMTDSTETFRFNNAKAGNRFLFVQANGYAPDLKRIEVGKDTGLFEFRLEPGHLIQGRVMDTQGNPISGVFVAASTWRGTQFLDWHTYTGTNGTFEWTDAPTDEVQFSFLKNEYRRLDKFALAPDSTNEVVTLQPPFIAHGSVTDAETGQPIASFRLALGRLFNGQVEPTWEGQNQRSFSDGQYEWNVRFSGRYLLRAEAEGYAPEISPPFDQAGEGFTHDFKLTRAAWIEGIVRKPDGQPAANTEVFLVVAGQAFMVENGRTEQGWEATPSRTDDNGHFRFSPTDKKFLVIALDDKGYAQAAFERMGPPIDLLLLPWARIEGEVRVGSRPAAGQKVQSSSQGLPGPDWMWVMLQANTMTDDHGHFLMDHVPAGNVSVGRSICIGERPRACSTTHSVRLVTKPGETSHVTIGGTGRPVIGRLVAPTPIELQSGAPYSHFKLHTRLPPAPETPHDWKTMTDEQKRAWLDAPTAEREAFRQAIQTMVSYPFGVRPDGSFRVEDVPPGDYQLDVTISELRTNGTAVLNEPIARLKHEFTVPVIPDGRSDEPLDLGELELKPVEPQQ